MSFNNKTAIVSGVGGIGSILAEKLIHHDLSGLVIIDINEDALKFFKSHMHEKYSNIGRMVKIKTIVADLSKENECVNAIKSSIEYLEKVDMLINTAGLNNFGLYGEELNSKIELMTKINLIAPMIMSNCIIPHMKRNGSGKIINIGSILGSVGFSCFVTYSATKFGLRGFSEALRRELHDDDISVLYIAPRAVETKMNSDAVLEMAKATGMNMDKPEDIVNKIILAILNDDRESFYGFSESILVRINSFSTKIVDMILRGNDRISKRFASK